jgi:hypothetical protein
MTAGESSASCPNSWVYAVLYKDQEGRDLGSLAVEPDFAPAREGALFNAIRSGLVPPVLGEARTRVVPVWDGELGAPIVKEACVIVPPEPGPGGTIDADIDADIDANIDTNIDANADDEAAAVHERIPAQADLFRQLAQTGSREMIARGVLREGQSFSFEIAAYPVSHSAGYSAAHPAAHSAAHSAIHPAQIPAPIGEPGASRASDDGAGFDFEDDGERLLLRERQIEELAAGARPAGHDADPGDVRAFYPEHVLSATFAHAESSGDKETGGFLLGFLERTPGHPEIFVEVTAQVPARHTDATNASLTFTSDTWTAVQNAVELRGRNELIVGWWHKHPNFAEKTCERCPEERRRNCPMSRPFFSATDVHMHRTVFPRAYQTALLLSDMGKDALDVRLYGWRHGAVVSRGFEIVPG